MGRGWPTGRVRGLFNKEMPVSDSDLTLPAKPPKKASRWGLFGPILVLAVVCALWSGYWFYTAGRIQAQVLQHQKALITAGYQASFDPIKVTGYPYRMVIDFRRLNIVSPSGKGFSAPAIRAEANAYALDNWVAEAPQGLTLYRGRTSGIDRGKVSVMGTKLKASAFNLSKPIPTIAIEGDDLILAASDATYPLPFTTAKSLEAHMRPTANVVDSADIMLNFTGAQGQPKSLAGDFGASKALSLQVEGAVSRVSAIHDFGASSAWAAKGGQVSAFRLKLVQGGLAPLPAGTFTTDCKLAAAGDLNVCASSDLLTPDTTGHVNGKLNIEMSGTFNPIDVLGALNLISPENMTIARPLLNLTLATQGTQTFSVDFHDGGAWIGPLKVSDAPILP